MILIYIDSFISSRLRYSLDFTFKEALGLNYEVTDSKDKFLQFSGPKLAYGNSSPEEHAIFIKKNGLIDHKGLELPDILQMQRWKKTTVLFYNQPKGKIPFDIFSAIFLLISRLEEYSKSNLDQHGRFEPAKSIAFEYGFMKEPIIDIWLFELKKILEKEFDLNIKMPSPKISITFDIDMVSKYSHLSTLEIWKRRVYYLLKGRFKQLKDINQAKSNHKNDPYEIVWGKVLSNVSKPLQCFILLSEGHQFDTNIGLKDFDYPKWIVSKKEQLYLHLHPSYKGHESIQYWKKEQKLLSQSTRKTITKSRFHYMKFEFPTSFQQLIEMDIKEDYSMGYGAINGYRASTSRSFYWYDVSKEEVTNLKVHPYCFMDSAAFFHDKKSTEESFNYLQKQLLQSLHLSTPMITVWHNYLLADQDDWLALLFRFNDLLKKNETERFLR